MVILGFSAAASPKFGRSSRKTQFETLIQSGIVLTKARQIKYYSPRTSVWFHDHSGCAHLNDFATRGHSPNSLFRKISANKPHPTDAIATVNR